MIDKKRPPFHGEVIIGDTSADRIAGRLSRRLGELSGFRLTSLDGPPEPVARWAAVDAHGQVVGGAVVIHHLVDGDRITVWVEAKGSGSEERLE